MNRVVVGFVGASMLSLLRRWQERRLLAEQDASVLIARFGVRASHMAGRRLAMMQNGEVVDSNRPVCHWKRVYATVCKVLPYDGPEMENAHPD
jgi:hypothetical protein